ncbi:MAG: DnaJ domain-containing protein [Myxococcaceae bacterium]|nr:DnaJ domain-containing protein [Myxococcaceae bacterium]
MGSAPHAPTSSPSRPAVSAPVPSTPSGAPVAPTIAGDAQPPPAPVPQSAPAVAALENVPPSGTLREVSPLRLYFLAAAQDLNGLLTFQLPDRAILMHFRKGSPDFVDSTHPEDALATFLLRQRLVGPEQLGQAQKEGARFGGELLPALFGLGLLNPNVALDALNQRVAGLIGQVLRATDGSFTLQAAALPPHKAMPAGNRWQLYVDQLRKIPTIELKARLHGALDFPVMKASGPVPVADLRLSPQETRAYAGFDGTRTLNQLLQSGAPEAEHAVRVAFMLEPCDLVSFAGTVVKTAVPARPGPPPPAQGVAPAPVPPRPVITPQGSPAAAPVAAAPAPAAIPVAVAPAAVAPAVPRPPGVPGNPVIAKPPSYPGGQAPVVSPARPPSAPVVSPPLVSAPSGVVSAPPAPALSTAQYDAEVKRLTDVLAKMKSQTHFEVLALTKDSPANAVKVAYFRLAKDYHPDTVPPGAPAALSKVKADIFARIGDANRTLADENLRKEYLAELEHGGTGEKVDVSKLLQAEEFFQKGKLLVGARKFAEAVKMLDDSIALMPDDAEAYAWRGYARFFTFTDKKAGLAEAMKDLQSCLKRNQNIVSAHFFQGMMHKLVGDLAAAKKHFNATVKLDPKHIDAQRELRMMK